jgi:hypothetical protein
MQLRIRNGTIAVCSILGSTLFCSNLGYAQTASDGKESFRGSLAVYGGIYSMSAPLQFPDFTDEYLVGLTGSASLWQFESLPITLEIDGTVAYRFGKESRAEVGILPVVRWTEFPWNDKLYTNFRFGPLGLSYLSKESDLEDWGEGASKLENFLIYEFTFANPDDHSNEFFFRHQHRCNIYGLFDDNTPNGSDILTVGYRKRF